MSTPVVYSRGQNPDYTVSPGPRLVTLATMAEEILLRLNQVAMQAGVTLPTRQFVYPGAVPVDCEQVVVLMAGWVGDPAQQGMTTCMNFRWCGQFGILITRCTPAIPTRSAAAPSDSQMAAAGELASSDAELLLALVATFGEIGPEAALLTPEPQGGFQSVVLNVTLPAFGGLD